MAVQDSKRNIIVGIEFGATHTHVAWAQTFRPESMNLITTWPINTTVPEGEISEKVPSKLRYEDGQVQWGFSIPTTAPKDEIIQWSIM